MGKILQLKTVSSLAKVFPKRIYGNITNSLECARGQEVSFQIAYRLKQAVYVLKDFSVVLNTSLNAKVSVFRVENVPSFLPVYPHTKDKNYITKNPGVFPDPLIPLTEGTVRAATKLWKALWISVKIPEDCPAGEQFITVSFLNAEGCVAEERFSIIVHDVVLPPQKLLFTQWFHCDCIADVHHVPVFSEEHWTLIEKYMKLASDHGMNTILTPVITPPLDTRVGSERKTVQLVDIEKNENGYKFDFSRLKRFINMARSCGILNFEISHFFTQWGAAHAPKVIARVNGEERRIFGWETDASSEEYATFLRLLIPALIDELVSYGVLENQIWFHISDEPNLDHLEAYRAAANIVLPLFGNCHHIDALSKFEFYKEGLLKTPVVATHAFDRFYSQGVTGFWCYYCCYQAEKVSNRFFAMPSSRNRIIGVQMYKYNIPGFLQWGYNYYYSRLSESVIDPYCVTDGGAAFPSGDTFSVYPNGDDVAPSLRQKVFANALEDMRLLELLEKKIGRENVIAEIDRIAGQELTFFEYPKDESFFEKLYRYAFSMLNE